MEVAEAKPSVSAPSALNQTIPVLEIIKYHEDMKRQLKEKYKSKYAQPPKTDPVPIPQPPQNLVHETAKEQLKSKMDEEIRRMAYKSLFGI